MIITLIHGTWARDAPWTQTTSELAKALAKALGNIHFERFAWSGSNSHRARSRAAEDLRQHIRDCSGRYPLEDHFLIAHSHGGNVVLYALRDSTVAASVRGVVCLSTPFIHCRNRKLGPAGLLPIGILAFLAYSWATFQWRTAILAAVDRILLPMLNRLTANIVEEIISDILFVVLMMALPIALWLLVDWFVTRRFSVPDLSAAIDRLQDSFEFPVMVPAPVLVIRAAGDEASAVLATSHFFAFLLTALSRAFGLLVKFGGWWAELNVNQSDWFRMKYSLLFMVLGFTAVLLPLPGHSPIQLIVAFVLFMIGVILAIAGFEMVGLIVVGIAGAPLLVLITLITIVTAPFGLDTALLAPLFEISAETTFPGNAKIFELSSVPVRGLRHSASYSSEEALCEITSWIRTCRSDRTEN